MLADPSSLKTMDGPNWANMLSVSFIRAFNDSCSLLLTGRQVSSLLGKIVVTWILDESLVVSGEFGLLMVVSGELRSNKCTTALSSID